MTQGILLFAFNNGEINYIKLAEIAAKQAKKFLDKPVSIVTDEKSKLSITEGIFDKIIVVEPLKNNKRTFRDGDIKNTTTSWINTHRYSAYNITPYDETLVLDVDYIVNSTTLNYCWDQPNDFLIYKNSFDLSQWREIPRYISDTGTEFYWATVFFFKKSKNVESLFTLITHIQENWNYYRFLYQISSPMFRNDFAFSIALHILNANDTIFKILPSKLYYTTDRDFLVKHKDRTFYFLMQQKTGQENYFPLKISNVDVHVMNKYSLLRTFDE